jgi:hypothetical protein
MFACPTDTSEQSSGRDPGRGYPQIDDCFNPLGHRNGSNVPPFADKINDGPMLFVLLQMYEVQISQFAPSESTAKQESENCSVPLSLQSVGRR